MKTASFILSAILIAPAAFAGSNHSIVGVYSYPHSMGSYGYDEKSCAQYSGHWEDGICFFEVSDDLVVSKMVQEYAIKVTTVTTNGHTCMFEAPANLHGRKLVAQVEVASTAADTAKPHKILCEVTAVFNKDASKASVYDNGNCQDYCGANASLGIDEANRVP